MSERILLKLLPSLKIEESLSTGVFKTKELN